MWSYILIAIIDISTGQEDESYGNFIGKHL